MNTPQPTFSAFHGDPAIKEKYVNRLAQHRTLEHLTQGVGWEDEEGEIKGCAVGCTLEIYDHERYPIELGLPVWLAHLEDAIFEGLPKGKAEQFAEDLLRVIPVGANVEPVRHQLAIARIDLAFNRLKANKEPYAAECRNALTLVKTWHQGELAGIIDESAAASARSAAASAESAAWSAAESVRLAAWSARSATESARLAAESAAWSAVCSAAWSAANSARSMAWSAAASAVWSSAESARSAYYEWEAATLLQLLSETK